MSKKSFIMHLDALDVLDELTDEQSGMLFKAIRAYQRGEEIELSGLMKAIFIPFKNQLDRDFEKHKAVCERNKANGKSGGRPKTQKTQSVKSKPKKPDNDSDSKNDSKNKNVNEDIPPLIPPVGEKPKPEKKKRGHRIPDDWECSEKLGEWAMSEGLSRDEVIREIDSFADHWKASTSKGSVALDWDLKFKTWIRNQVKWRAEKR